MLKMSSRKDVISSSVIYVLSRIPKLVEALQSPNLSLNLNIKPVEVSDGSNGPILDEKALSSIQEAKIILCDPILLAETYTNMPNLRWAHCTWAGVEPLMKAIPIQPDFLVTRHAGEDFSSLMAEYVMCQILNLERKMKLCWKSQEDKIWANQEDFSSARSLHELTVGILGVGNMASGVAKFLKSRGTTVLGISRRPKYHGQFFDRISTRLDHILPECDYIINTLPSTRKTRGLLNCSILEKCPKKPVFINVGRGDIISEYDLALALRNGWLSGAVLDVFEDEPLPVSSGLWSMPQVFITPHVAAISKPQHIAEEFCRNFLNYAYNHQMSNIVSWSHGY